MTPRDLIAAARAAGFRPVHRTLTGRYTWVWQKCDPDGRDLWRVEVTKPHNSLYPWEIESMVKRSDVGWYPIDKCGPYNCVQAAAILRAVGVLPSPTRSSGMSDLSGASTADLAAELQRRGAMPRCRCSRWQTYLGVYDRDGYTLRCRGCRRAIARCTCR